MKKKAEEEEEEKEMIAGRVIYVRSGSDCHQAARRWLQIHFAGRTSIGFSSSSSLAWIQVGSGSKATTS